MIKGKNVGHREAESTGLNVDLPLPFELKALEIIFDEVNQWFLLPSAHSVILSLAFD